MKIKVELNAEKYAIGKCPYYEEVVAGGRVCRMLCKYSSNFNIKERTFECAAPSLQPKNNDTHTITYNNDTPAITYIGSWKI